MIQRNKNMGFQKALVFWFTLLLIIIGLIFCYITGHNCYNKYKKKHNFFGHNNGEDDLVIEHNFYQPPDDPAEPIETVQEVQETEVE